ncbi:MAG: hypothetical protein COV44_07005, partial [Deltaproteobacteria bacterium CG11_big_fil_rev_8_21_14_0_20_45_16]
MLAACSGGESKMETPPPSNNSKSPNTENSHQLASYCGEDRQAANAEKSSGPKDDIKWLDQNYPAPDPRFEFDPNSNIQHLRLDDQDVMVITFDIYPFKSSYATEGDSIFEEINMRTRAILAVPENLKDKNSLVFSINAGTANGLPHPSDWDLTDPKKHDPIRSAAETPSFFKGTLHDSQYQETYSRIALHFNVPILFYDSVPNGIVFQSNFERKLRDYAVESSPDFSCNDLTCEQTIDGNNIRRGAWSDDQVNNCLTFIALADSNIPNLIHYHSGNFYALANDRAIDAAQAVLNQTPALGGNFNISRITFFGGSKRGIASRTSLVGLDRAVGAMAGHSNAGNYLTMFDRRAAIYKDQPE